MDFGKIYALRLRPASTSSVYEKAQRQPSSPLQGCPFGATPRSQTQRATLDPARTVRKKRSIRQIEGRICVSRVTMAHRMLRAPSARHLQANAEPASERGGSDGSQCVAIADSPAAKVVAPPYSQRRLVSDHAESSMTAPPESAKPLCIAHHHLSRAQAVRSSQSARQWRRTA